MTDQSGPSDAGRWVRDDASAVSDAFLDDFYGGGEMDDEFGAERTNRFRAYVFVVIVLLVVAGIGFTLSGGDDDPSEDLGGDDVEVADEPNEAAEEESDEPDEAAAEAETTSEPAAPTLGTTGDPLMDQVLLALGVNPGDPRVARFPDLVADLLDSISVNTPSFVREDIDMVELVQVVARMSADDVDRVFNQSTIECGATEPFIVVCPEGVQPMPEGDVYALGMTLAEPAPDGDPAHSFIYSAVFDSDGDPANDWTFNPPFDFDLFQGADRWYQLAWSHHAQAWDLTVSQVDTNQQVSSDSSSVRAAIAGSNIMFFVSAAEVGEGAHRLTSFGHDGAFSESDRGADVGGAVPTEPLAAITAEPIETIALDVPAG